MHLLSSIVKEFDGQSSFDEAGRRLRRFGNIHNTIKVGFMVRFLTKTDTREFTLGVANAGP